MKQTTTNSPSPVYKRNRLVTEMLTLKTEDESVIGIFQGIKHIEPTKNYPDGLDQVLLVMPDTGEEKALWLNGGLKGALTMAQVKKDQLIEIVYKGKTEFGETEDGQPRFVNNYEIFGLTQ